MTTPPRTRPHCLALAPLGAALAILSLTACRHEPPSPAPAATPAATAAPATAQHYSIRVEYRQPKNKAHQPVLEYFQSRKSLERFADGLAFLELQKPLALVMDGCDGVSNAWYEASTGEVTYCFEYLSEFVRNAPLAVKDGIPEEDAIMGPFAFILLHEMSHALFDLAKVPIFGHEEDAADQLAAYLLLAAGRDLAKKVLTGAAWTYRHEARSRTPDASDFADVHSLDSQRFYNMACLAYGSDIKFFAGVVEKGILPKERAEGCEEEFLQVDYAVKKLLRGTVDETAFSSLRARNAQKWGKQAARTQRR